MNNIMSTEMCTV